MYSLNYQRLAKLITESAKALGKTLSDPTVQKTIAAVIGSSVATGIVVDQIDKQNTKKIQIAAEEKEALYKEALAQNEAMIRELKAKVDLGQERQDYLVSLNEQLLNQVKVCKDEDANEQI